MLRSRQTIGGLGNQLFRYAYLYAQMRDGVVPDIYVQNHKYFDTYREEIRQLLGDDLKESDFVSLHIRKGDYTNNQFYVDLTKTDYYDKAIKMFPNGKFLVFCADRQDEETDREDKLWCLDWLSKKGLTPGVDFIFWNSDSEIDDFNAMAGCNAHIMANSSFSWWASYVGGGETIAPKNWFTDGVERVGLLKEWKII